jgi:hypothetical protein
MMKEQIYRSLFWINVSILGITAEWLAFAIWQIRL